jgi:ketosteroid isomerase-like protein
MKHYQFIQKASFLNLKTLVCLLGIFILFPIHSFAQDKEIEKQIKNLDEKQSAVMLKEDTNELKKMYDPDIIVNAPFNAVTNGREVIFHLVKTGFIKLSAFSINVEKIIVKNDLAVSMGSETITFAKDSTNPNAGQTIKRRYTHVYLREQKGWQLIARHANEICQ